MFFNIFSEFVVACVFCVRVSFLYVAHYPYCELAAGVSLHLVRAFFVCFAYILCMPVCQFCLVFL